jgi:hypothetical protein
MKNNLPKQWLHWAKKTGLKPERYRSRFAGFYMIGRGRRWRVNMHGAFECSCLLADFDRWANSRGAEQFELPSSEMAFSLAVENLERSAAFNET